MRISPHLILILFVPFLQISFARDVRDYSTSYVFVSATNKQTGQQVEVCANYQQFRKADYLLPETYEEAKPFIIRRWRNESNNTRICPITKSSTKYTGSIVPLEYRIEDDHTSCTRPFVDTQTSFRNASQFQVETLKSHDAFATLFLLDKGKQFVKGWKDYLFSDFYDPYIQENRIPTFFIYRTVFEKALSVGNDENDIEIRIHRPKNHKIDLSMVVIWLIAVFSVSAGGLWAFHRQSLGKDTQLAEATVGSNEKEEGLCYKYGNYLAIGMVMLLLVTVIMLGYFYRPYLVLVFNIALVLFGTSSVHGCLRAFLSNFPFSKHDWYRAKLAYFSNLFNQKEAYTYTGTISVLLSFTFCTTWFFVRKTPYAFILLDFINVTLCLHILKSLRLPSLKWISILMICMFVYDAVMVFGTPLLTKNGCSIMLEVATGIDCSSGRSNNSGYPLPPIESATPPEKFPMLMQVMHFDPMISCMDLEVERSYQMTILGLGDIIIPGYLVAHSFTMNGFDKKIRLLYGIVCTIGYGFGLIATFIALTLMKMAQPALIYLVPFTLIPICILAIVRKEFCKVWNGVPYDKTSSTSDNSENSEDRQNMVEKDSSVSENV